MPKVKIEGCTHTLFTCDFVEVPKFNTDVAIVRCIDCGQAIGAFLPGIPDAINRIGERLDSLEKRIKNLS